MKNFLNENIETLLCEFWDFSEKTEKWLRKFNIALRLPIDIQDFAKRLGIRIELTKTPSFSENYIAYAARNTIILKANLSYKEQRWVIAKALANFFLYEYGIKEFLIPNQLLVSSNHYEFFSDTIAILLLFPISIFKKEISENIGKTKSDLFDLLEYLSDKTQISQSHIITGYEIMKLMLCFQRNSEFEKSNYDITKITPDQYENIFI